jgi:hypothetical protein
VHPLMPIYKITKTTTTTTTTTTNQQQQQSKRNLPTVIVNP